MTDYILNKSIPIGINETGTREEFDSMGKVNVPANRYWGHRLNVHYSTLILAMI